MVKKILVTGLGIISGIGKDLKENYFSLINKKTGISEIKRVNTLYKGILPVSEVKLSNKQLADRINLNYRNYTRTDLLGITAAVEAVKSAGIKEISDCKTGLISATTVGGMDRSEKFYTDFFENDKKGSLKDIIWHKNSASTEKIADWFGIKDYVNTINTACSSSANAIMLGAKLIQNNILDRVLVGGADAITKFTINGFNSLMILEKQHCKPFDNARKGLNLGEAGAFLVLESSEVAKNRKAFCKFVDGANTNDAYHQTASSPEGYGALLSMQKALNNSQIPPSKVDYINVHGTATKNNDSSEAKAISKIFGENIPFYSSTKAYTGHTLAAAGAVEAVFSALSIKNNIIFPNLNFETKLMEIHKKPVTEILKTDVKVVLSNSFGFGGNYTSIILGCANT